MPDQSSSTIRAVSILVAFCVMIFATVIGACDVSPERATRVLRGAGYSEIVFRGHAWFSCSEDDLLSVKFSALGPNGQRANGAVCCGIMAKDCTIRSE